MYMIVVNSLKFRDKQTEYMDKADKSEQIILQRGDDKAYAITLMPPSGIFVDTQLLSADFIPEQQIRERVHQHIDKLFSESK